MNALVSIVGPTASGKSGMAVALAKHFGAPVVSVDSVQMYRGLDIGSGKVTETEKEGVLHYLLDCVEPDQQITAAEFGRLAEAVIAELHQNYPLVFTAGGSGFYLQALLEGLDDMPEIPAEIRQAVRMQFEKEGLGGLLTELEAIDPETFAKIDKNNPVRVCRAIEVFRAGGRPISDFRKGMKAASKPYRQLMIGMQVERAELRGRIDQRVDQMIAQGWLEEVKGLLEKYPANSPAFGSLGYRELIGFKEGRVGWEQTVELIKIHTHQFAKRQMTWFQRYPEIIWIDPKDISRAILLVDRHLQEC